MAVVGLAVRLEKFGGTCYNRGWALENELTFYSVVAQETSHREVQAAAQRLLDGLDVAEFHRQSQLLY